MFKIVTQNYYSKYIEGNFKTRFQFATLTNYVIRENYIDIENIKVYVYFEQNITLILYICRHFLPWQLQKGN